MMEISRNIKIIIVLNIIFIISVFLVALILNMKASFYFFFYGIYIAVVTVSSIIYFLYIKNKIGEEEKNKSGLNYEQAEQQIREYVLSEAGVQIGKTMSVKGVRKLGREGEEKEKVFLWHFRDMDNANEYLVGINMEEPDIKSWTRNPDQKKIVEFFDTLTSTKDQIVTTVREVTDPLSGRVSTETTRQPFYMEKEKPIPKKDDEEGTL